MMVSTESSAARSLCFGIALLSASVGAGALASCSATGADRTFAGATTSGESSSGATRGSASSGMGGSLTLGTGGSGGSSSSSTGPGGPTVCDASCSAAGGTCSNGTCTILENPGMVSSGTQSQLEAGGRADPNFVWLYPYDKTVFPRGLMPPTMQFGGGSPTAVYVHVTFPGMNYQGFYGSSSPAQVTFSQPVWSAITLAALAGIQVKVEVTKIAGGKVTGPITETWSIAQGSLRGTIYYETYDSQILGGVGSVGIMKLQPGASAPTGLLSGCGSVCHTASADGSTLVAAGPGLFLTNSTSYDLTNNAAVLYASGTQQFVYGALYPDGSIAMSATGYRTAFGAPSRLSDTKTGAAIAAPGWDSLITNGGTLAFSPDGKQIAFNHEDTGQGHTLAVMDFNRATTTFSNLRDVASNPATTLAWPAFTPDGKWVLFHSGSSADFETDDGATGDLYFTSATSASVRRLDALDGYTSSTGTANYLPAQDPGLSFAPTVLPEAVGGYYWVVFTSHRSYGNVLPSMDGPSGSPDEYGKLWVSAFDINAAPGADPSHPAFFLSGQELDSDNLRGFWVLNPCKQAGNACTSGDDCCTGFCRSADGGPTECVTPPAGCSNEYEACSTAADCCNAGYACINNRCAQPAAQ